MVEVVAGMNTSCNYLKQEWYIDDISTKAAIICAHCVEVQSSNVGCFLGARGHSSVWTSVFCVERICVDFSYVLPCFA